MGAEQDESIPGWRGASSALQYVTGWDSWKANHRRKGHTVLTPSRAHHCPSQRGTCIYKAILRIWAPCLSRIVICVCVVQFIVSFGSWQYVAQSNLRLLRSKSQDDYAHTYSINKNSTHTKRTRDYIATICSTTIYKYAQSLVLIFRLLHNYISILY